jgi:hypothetical protein
MTLGAAVILWFGSTMIVGLFGCFLFCFLDRIASALEARNKQEEK